MRGSLARPAASVADLNVGMPACMEHQPHCKAASLGALHLCLSASPPALMELQLQPTAPKLFQNSPDALAASTAASRTSDLSVGRRVPRRRASRRPLTPDGVLSGCPVSAGRAPRQRSGNRPVRTVGRNGTLWYMMYIATFAGIMPMWLHPHPPVVTDMIRVWFPASENVISAAAACGIQLIQLKCATRR